MNGSSAQVSTESLQKINFTQIIENDSEPKGPFALEANFNLPLSEEEKGMILCWISKFSKIKDLKVIEVEGNVDVDYGKQFFTPLQECPNLNLQEVYMKGCDVDDILKYFDLHTGMNLKLHHSCIIKDPDYVSMALLESERWKNVKFIFDRNKIIIKDHCIKTKDECIKIEDHGFVTFMFLFGLKQTGYNFSVNDEVKYRDTVITHVRGPKKKLTAKDSSFLEDLRKNCKKVRNNFEPESENLDKAKEFLFKWIITVNYSSSPPSYEIEFISPDKEN